MDLWQALLDDRATLRPCAVCRRLVVLGHDDARRRTILVHGALAATPLAIDDRDLARAGVADAAGLDRLVHARLPAKE